MATANNDPLVITIQSLDRANKAVVRIRDVPVRTSNSTLQAACDWRELSYLSAPVSQGTCGSCWAVTCVTALRDRINIAHGQHVCPPLSAQYLLDCAKGCISYNGQIACSEACEGGFLAAGLAFLSYVGVPAERDLPYKGCAGGVCTRKGPKCPGVPPFVYKCDTFYQVSIFDSFAQINTGRNEIAMTPSQQRLNSENIMREVRDRGPVCTVFNLFSDFEDYWDNAQADDVYQAGWRITDDRAQLGTVAEQQLGNMAWTANHPGPLGLYLKEMHAVVIVGYGTTATGIPYWIIRNSWGTNRMGGYAKVRRGNNTLGIESSVVACYFDEDSLRKSAKHATVNMVWNTRQPIRVEGYLATASNTDVAMERLNGCVSLQVAFCSLALLIIITTICMAYKIKKK